MTTNEHPTSAVVEEIRELEQVASDGGSSLTPAVVFANMFVLTAIVVLVMLALALFAYRLAS